MKTTAQLLTVTSAFLLLSTGCAGTQTAPPETASTPAPAPARPARAPAPKQELAEAPAGPALNSKEIRVAVSSISEDLQQCYLAGTFRDASLAGTVAVTFTIEPSGRVSSAVDSGSDMADPDVVECVIDCFAGLSFRPGGQNPTEVTYPIRFNRRS